MWHSLRIDWLWSSPLTTAAADLVNSHHQQQIRQLRHLVLSENLADYFDPIRLVSMSRFIPYDHNDCIIASEIISPAVIDDYSSVTYNAHQPSTSTSTTTNNPTTASANESSTLINLSIFQKPTSSRLSNSIRNALSCQSWASLRATYHHHRKLLSCILLFGFVSVFCLISTSLINSISDNPPSPNQVKYTKNLNKDGSTNYDEYTASLKSNSDLLQTIELDEIFQNQLAAIDFNGSWASNDKLAFYDMEYNLCLYDLHTRTSKPHIKYQYVLTKSLKELQLSADLNFLLTSSDTIELFRYSKLEKFKLYDIKNNSLIDLFEESNYSSYYFQFGQFGPRRSQLVFAYNNDLYYRESAWSETIRLTTTGLNSVVYNGHSDWLYEEEILNTNRAIWFSPNGTYLAYLQLNSTLVDVQSWNRYGDYYNISNNQYPVMQSVRYPKPGTNNPEVSLYVVNLHRNVEKIRIDHIYPPESIAKQDYYITKVVWFDNDRLLLAWTVRNQTQSLLVICSRFRHWKCEELYKLNSKTGWIDGFQDGLLSAASFDSVLVRIPQLFSAKKDYFYHVASINVYTKKVEYLTKGAFDVIKLIAYNPTSNEVFYSSTLANHPEVQHIMKMNLIAKHEPICLTCFLGNSCLFNEATFNHDATSYVLECKGYEIPKIEVRNAQSNSLIELWENNAKLYSFLRNKYIPRYEKIFVKLTDNFDAIVELVLPHTFDEGKRYPVVVELYGAPNTQTVLDKYEMNHWSSYLTSQREYIYARVDVRGTANQGLRHMHQLYKNIGHIEVDDFIDVIWYLKNNLTYVDPERIALWGWSYGGYFSLMSLIREFDNRLFSCAIAVAPVSNWMYYDSAYSERYLGIPDKQNLHSYQDSNLLDNAILLKNKKFMIVFGTSDDNVHIQHSLLLIRKLNELNIDYDVQIYPDDNHFLLKSTSHLYRKMSNYIQKCFDAKQ